MKRNLAFLLFLICTIGICGLIGTTVQTEERSLYDRLGGKTAITAVVDKFVANVAADNRVNAAFEGVDIPHFKECMVNQICEATGGPCKYTCRSMKDSHAGLGCSDSDFNAIVEDLVAAMNSLNVPKAEQDGLLSLLAPMKGDIVTKP